MTTPYPTPLHELALFAGAGGGILGGKLLGWRTVCAVEWDAYARDVLVARQNDGCLEAFPIWDDVQTFDGRPWRGRIDVVSGGFPCQDISAAGKGAGIEGERSGMWKHMARIIGEVLPRFVWVENSPMLVGRGLGVVLADLAQMGYDARWGIVGAHHAGAPHKRDRIWVVGDSERPERWPQRSVCEGLEGQDCLSQREKSPSRTGVTGQNVANANHDGTPASERSRIVRGSEQDARRQEEQDGVVESTGSDTQPALSSYVADTMRGPEQEQGYQGCAQLPHWKTRMESGSGGAFMGHAAISGLPHGPAEPMGEPRTDAESERSDWWATEPDVGRVAHGVAARVDRLRCIGNGQVSAVVPLAWHLLSPQPPEN